jgi:hypothetical protein
VAEDDFEAGIVFQDREAVLTAHILKLQTEMADEEIRRGSDIGNVEIEMVQAHDSLRSKKSRDCFFCRLRTPPGSRILMRITSRVLVPWHGAELRQSA